MEKSFTKLGVMVDCSRNSVMNLTALKRLTDLLAGMGYNALQLYTEDTFEVNGEPYFGYMRGRYGKTEIKELDAYCKSRGVELIPCVQTLAHLNQAFRWPDYAAINDAADILLVGEERTYKLIENIFATLAECFSSREAHIGMDEAHMLGLGKYLDKHGYVNRHELMLSHLSRVVEIAGKYGFSCMMWSDMFFRLSFGGRYYADGEIPESVRKKVPAGLKLVYWDYYADDKSRYDAMIRRHKEFDNPTVFAGGAWTWTGLAPSNAMSISRTKSAFESCREHGVTEAYITMWGDNGGACSPFSVLPSLFAAARFAEGETDISAIKRGFEELVGMPFDTFMYADLPNVLADDQPRRADVNPSKYLFYNDPLLGIFDCTVTEGIGKVFADRASKLKRAESFPEWSFLFKPLRLLCEALSVKAALGLKTRKAYKAGDKAALKALIAGDYKPLIGKIELFYESFAAYWDTLFKPHGFDVMDIRIGGLLRRLKHAVSKLDAYVSGKAPSIPELDESVLNPWSAPSDADTALCFNEYNKTSTVNVL
ncbi:MAG: beta-N-acetylhexosaminidase [Clostridiales bacterium]|jgi:hypothetical protein|nr:beta-N-acetylhexosaminidase [Clostridiales bacterium]